MKRLLLLLVLVPAFVSARPQAPTDKTMITFIPQAGQYVYAISAGGATTQLSNSTIPNEQLLQFARDLALAAQGVLVLGPDGVTLQSVPTGTTPVPNALINAVLAKNIAQITGQDGTTVLFGH